jgi:hypothetical protein
VLALILPLLAKQVILWKALHMIQGISYAMLAGNGRAFRAGGLLPLAL